ncbi:MAG: hypothetical protein OEV38_14490, partial [Nitrospira sp.]|nr:hypothetical protein [Nitrospira sp.]
MTERGQVQIHVQGHPVERHSLLNSHANETDLLRLRRHDPHTRFASDANAGDIPALKRANEDLLKQ